MSLWQKIILNRGFAVTREIIYEHKFSFYTIFLTRPEHSNFNACKIFVKIVMILVIMIENLHLFHYFFIIFGTRAKWNKLATCYRKCPLQFELVVRKPVFGVSDQV